MQVIGHLINGKIYSDTSRVQACATARHREYRLAPESGR